MRCANCERGAPSILEMSEGQETDMSGFARRILFFLFLAAALASLFSAQGNAQNPPGATAAANPTANTGSTDAELRSQLERLERLVGEQQKRIEAREAERQGPASAPASATSAAAATQPLADSPSSPS